jgi:hypothetical protein
MLCSSTTEDDWHGDASEDDANSMSSNIITVTGRPHEVHDQGQHDVGGKWLKSELLCCVLSDVRRLLCRNAP